MLSLVNCQFQTEQMGREERANESESHYSKSGWVGLGGTTGRGSKTLSKIFSLAPKHQFTHFGFTSGGVIPEKIPHHSHMCTGEFTQTGVTLTVFLYNIQVGTVFTLIHKNLGKMPKKVIKKTESARKVPKKGKVPEKVPKKGESA